MVAPARRVRRWNRKVIPWSPIEEQPPHALPHERWMRDPAGRVKRVILAVKLLDGTEMVLYALQPRQNECFRLTPLDRTPDAFYPRHIGYGGAAGGGKSYFARAVAVTACVKWPGCSVIIFRRTKGEVIKNHVKKFKEEVPEFLPDGRRLWSYNGEEMCATFMNGSQLYFGYLNHEDDKDKHQGNEYDIEIFEEATHNPWETVRWLTGNRLRATRPYCRPFVLYPSNPGNVGHWWYKRLFVDRRFDPRLNEIPENYVFVQAKVEDNLELVSRDPAYVSELATMPEPYRSWLKDGNFNAGPGLALTNLDRRVHFVPQFEVPSHWTVFGAFDWGFNHPFSFGWYCVNEDGRVFKGDTITGRHLSDREIADRIVTSLRERGIEPARLLYITAGHDCWDEVKARASGIPTTAETFQDFGLYLSRANTSRIAGLKQLRKMLDWQRVLYDRHGQLIDDDPYLRFMDTPGNQACFDQLEQMASDPDNPEDALKVDADLFGNGGDDMYDETRYAMASRPAPARSSFATQEVSAWSPAALQYEMEKGRRGQPFAASSDIEIIHPEFGVL